MFVNLLLNVNKKKNRELSSPLIHWSVMMELLEIKLDDPFLSELLKAKAEKSALKRIKKIISRLDEPCR